MKPTLLNSIKFLAYITPFLLGFTFILLAAMNGTPLPAIVYFGVLALTMFIVSLIVVKSDTPLPTNYNELCKTWGWNFYDDAYYRPSLATYFIVFTAMYNIVPMFMNSNVNYWFMFFLILVFALDSVVNYGINKCYTVASYTLASVFGMIVGGVSSALINTADPNLMLFGNIPSDRQSCGRTSNKNFKCLVYKNGQLIKRL